MPRLHALAAPLGALTLALTLAACGGGGGDDPAAPSAGSGATCPPGGTSLRYAGGGDGGTEPADFGASFFAASCLSCHGAVPSNGAPGGAAFDTLASIRAHAQAIDQRAAAGPARVNTSMPPAGSPAPSLAARTSLGVWLACGAP